MRPHAVVSVLVGALCGCAAELRAGPASTENQPPMRYWAEQIAGSPLPETARTRAAFESLPLAVNFPELLRVVGPPDRETGSGLSVFVWALGEEDGEVHVATPDLLAVQYIDWVQARAGKRVRLRGR